MGKNHGKFCKMIMIGSDLTSRCDQYFYIKLGSANCKYALAMATMPHNALYINFLQLTNTLIEQSKYFDTFFKLALYLFHFVSDLLGPDYVCMPECSIIISSTIIRLAYLNSQLHFSTIHMHVLLNTYNYDCMLNWHVLNSK